MKSIGTRIFVPLVMSAAAVLSLAPSRPASAPPLNSLRPIEWGMYYYYWRADYQQVLRRVADQFGRPPEYVMFFIDLRLPFQQGRIDAIHALGATPQLSMELIPWHRGKKDSSYLPDIKRGEFDEFFRRWATAAKRDGRRLQLRFGYEFNGDWFSWSHDPEGFKSAWRRAHGIFKTVGADNVEWVWAANVVSCPDTPENSMHLYYPGDEYVDWVGIDGYNFGDHHDEWHTWESAEQVYRKTLDDLLRRFPRPRFLISEFGCAPGKPGARARWIREAYRLLAGYKRIEAAVWYHQDKRSEGEPNWKLVSEDGSLEAFSETFARPSKKQVDKPR